MLKTLCIWCVLCSFKFNASAPTGIAAAGVEIEDTEISATTLHKLFGLNFDVGSKLNFHESLHKLFGRNLAVWAHGCC